MSITAHDRRVLRFVTGILIVFTGLSALLVILWLPSLRVTPEVAKNLAVADASSRLFGNVERQEPTELAERLSSGADPNTRKEVSWGDHKKVTSALNIAIRNGDYGSVQMLLSAGADPNLALPQAPLQTALERNVDASDKQKLVQLLLKSGAEIRSLSDKILEEELPDAVAILQQQGIEYGLREMCIAGDFGSLKEHLATPLQGEATHVREYYGTSTLLGIALRRSHAQIADWLLKSGSSTDVDDVSLANAIHLASIGNCVEILRPLVLAGCDINAGDDSGDTPLNYALYHSEPETIAALIALGANVLQVHEGLGLYPIHQAANRYYRAHSQESGAADADQIVLELLRAGADEKQLDASGRTAMDLTHELRDHFEKLISSRTIQE